MKHSLEGLPIVTSKEMARIEKLSPSQAESYMLTAGEGIAAQVLFYVDNHGYDRKITLIVGKGNNGGDAYVVGLHLLKRRFSVKAFYLFDTKECSELNQKYQGQFVQAGGELLLLKEISQFIPYEKAPIIDGLLGTGFSGETTGLLQELIEATNATKLPILSIDIPSGLDGNTGMAKGSVICAKETYYLGNPKVGFFLHEGYEKVGILRRVDFGLQHVERMQAVAYLLEEKHVASFLPAVKRTRHKYERGYVLVVAGSKHMPGAALLSSLATLRSGAGIVRLFHPEGLEEIFSHSFEELIKTPWSIKEDSKIFEEAKRANSLLLGPGLGVSTEVEQEIVKILQHIDKPCVLDADALLPFALHAKSYPSATILTPHRKEMMRCLQVTHSSEEELLMECQKFADQKQVTIVLKGAPTWIFHPKTLPLVVAHGDPGMATAGAGDVLAGVIAALLAQGLAAREAAALGVYLHALAGEMAALEKTSYSMIASDLIECLPGVFRRMQE